MKGDDAQTYLAVSIIWSLSSTGMMVFNKIAIAAFPLVCTLLFLQMTFGVLIISIVGWRSLHIGSFRDLLLWLRAAPLFTGVLLTSILALKDAPMSVVIVFRALAPLLGLAAESFVLDPLPITMPMVICLLGMLGGVGLYARHMPGATLVSLWSVTLNSLFVIGDRLLQRKMLDRHLSPVDISKASCVVINNAVGAILMVILALINQEVAQAHTELCGLDAYSGTVVFITCVAGVCIGYSGVWLQSLISATDVLVLATANKFAMFLFVMFFSTYQMTASQVLGATIIITCAFLYWKASDNAEAMRNPEEKDPFAHASESASESTAARESGIKDSVERTGAWKESHSNAGWHFWHFSPSTRRLL